MNVVPLRRDPEYGYPSIQSTIEFAAESTCTYFEILHSEKDFSGTTAHGKIHKNGTLNEDSLNEYLTKDVSGSPGLRVIMGACSFNPVTQCSILPFSERAMNLLKGTLALPAEFDQALHQRCARAFKFSLVQPSTSYIFKFGIYRPSYYHLAVHHNPDTKHTTALLISKTSTHAFTSLTSSLLSRSHLSSDPFFLPTLISQLVTDSAETRIQSQDTMLNILEESMGQHEYVNRPMGNPLEIDFAATTRRLSAISRVLQVERMRVDGLMLALAFMKGERELLFNSRSEAREGLKEQVDDMISCQRNFCQNLALRAESEEKRAQSQVAVVYQYMAQKDAKVNIRLAETSTTIAEESKKDSSAMKAIAVLTMCFLPGTFLAALFAMPFFVWESGSPVVREGFKYYWALAIPLTLAVLLIWVLCVWLPWGRWGEALRLRLKASSGRADIEGGRLKGSKDN